MADEAEQAVVARIQDGLRSGESLAGIARRLNDEGIRLGRRGR